jgi:timeless
MWALRFFLEFNRSHKFRVDLVSETISLSVFHYVVKQIDHYSDMMVTDKRKVPLWGKRLHLAVRAYHELLVNVGYMTASRDEVMQSAAKVIKGNIFYMPEFRDLLQVHLHRYNAGKLSV